MTTRIMLSKMEKVELTRHVHAAVESTLQMENTMSRSLLPRPHNPVPVLTGTKLRRVSSRMFAVLSLGVALLCAALLCAALEPVAAEPAEQLASALTFTVVEGAGGVPLNVVTAGDKSKPPILLVHGIGQSYVSWENQLRAPLTDEFYMVAFDLRGHGNSGKPWGKENYTDYRNYAGDVQSVINATGIDRPVLSGWSYGTLIVADYLRAYGASGLRGIVLTGAYGGFTPSPQAPAAMVAQMAKIRAMQLSSDIEENIVAARGGVRFLAAREMTPAYWERATQISLMLPAYARRYMFERSLANMDQIPGITVPLLINVGGKDISTPELQGRELAAKVPGAQVSVYPESGHSPFAEEPERYNFELAAFARAAFARR
jgi:pimeloyl-ACP methyl ester carboxylesterase